MFFILLVRFLLTVFAINTYNIDIKKKEYRYSICLIVVVTKNVIGVKREKKMYGQSKYGVNTII